MVDHFGDDEQMRDGCDEEQVGYGADGPFPRPA